MRAERRGEIHLYLPSQSWRAPQAWATHTQRELLRRDTQTSVKIWEEQISSGARTLKWEGLK